MSKAFEIYIQQQLEVAKAEHNRKIEEALAEGKRKDAECRAISIKNTLRVLSLIGIEATEEDLSIRNDGFISFASNDIRLWLDVEQQFNLRGIHSLDEGDQTPLNMNAHREQAHHYIRFQLWMRHLGTENLHDNEYVVPSHHSVDFQSEHGVTPNRLPDTEIAAIFALMVGLQEAYEDYPIRAAHVEEAAGEETEASPETTTPTLPKFTYSGDSRESILAELLRDITNPPKLECSYCGRRAVNPIDLYCVRCGADYEGEI